MRKRRLDSILTILLPAADRLAIQSEAEARGESMAEVVRELISVGLEAKGLVA